MKKQEIEMIVNSNKRRRSDTLVGIIQSIKRIESDREQTKSMWFWNENGNIGERNSKEDYYYRDNEIKLNGLRIKYYRNISMSRKHVYVDESLIGALPNGEEIKMTVSDLRKICAGLQIIVDDRNKSNAAG